MCLVYLEHIITLRTSICGLFGIIMLFIILEPPHGCYTCQRQVHPGPLVVQ
jgi:hypothetical protein